jgi:hypothetical protein
MAKSGEGQITSLSPASDVKSSPPSLRKRGRAEAGESRPQLDLSHGSERFGHPELALT